MRVVSLLSIGFVFLQSLSARADAFDPKSCEGPAMTRAEAIARFAPGTTETIIGTYVIEKRQRTCNAVTGCGSWQAPVTKLAASLGRLTPDLELRGEVRLVLEGTDIRVKLVQDGNLGSYCSLADAATQSCTTYAFNMGSQWGGSGGYYPTVVPLSKVDNKNLTLSGVLTSTCLRLTDSAKSDKFEEEYAVLATLTAGQPIPLAQCPINHSFMQCGGKAGKGATTCCQAGLTTCAQSGCDCWASCR